MNLAKYREAVDAYSGKASEVARTLSLSGIAVIWVFAVQDSSGHALPRELLLPSLLIVAHLALDLVHYLVGYLMWVTFCRFHERKGVGEEAPLDAPSWINWPGNFIFWLKFAAVIAAYYFLSSFLLRVLFGIG